MKRILLTATLTGLLAPASLMADHGHDGNRKPESDPSKTSKAFSTETTDSASAVCSGGGNDGN